MARFSEVVALGSGRNTLQKHLAKASQQLYSYTCFFTLLNLAPLAHQLYTSTAAFPAAPRSRWRPSGVKGALGCQEPPGPAPGADAASQKPPKEARSLWAARRGSISRLETPLLLLPSFSDISGGPRTSNSRVHSLSRPFPKMAISQRFG